MKRTAHSIHRTGFAIMRGVHLVAANDAAATEHRCPRCGTVYFRPQECDWCPTRAELNDRRALELQIAAQIRSEWRPS